MLVKKTVELRVATPLLVGGLTKQIPASATDIGKEKNIIVANLNGNSIKGALRWWLRSLVGWSDQKLPVIEKEIFGSKDQKSPFSLKIIQHNLNSVSWDRNELQAQDRFGQYQITYKSNPKNINYNGFNYLSFFNRVPERNRETIHEYYEVGQLFKIELIGSSQATIDKVLAIFWVLLQFGGLGYRSRRGFGKLEIVSDTPNEHIEFRNTYKNFHDYQNVVESNLTNILSLINETGTNQIPTIQNASLYLNDSEAHSDWKEALNFAGITMQAFRLRLLPDYQSLKEKFHGNLNLIKPIFGLPIRFKFSSINKQGSIENFKDTDKTRLASPIIPSLVKIGDKYHSQYLLLNYSYNNLNMKAFSKYKNKNQEQKQNARVNVAPNAIDAFEKHLQAFEIDSESYSYSKIF